MHFAAIKLFLRWVPMNQSRPQRGFGLIEVLLSTAIFIVVVGSLVALSRMAIRNAILATHRTQAFNLAQDGIETVRQMRDTNWLDETVKVNDQNQPYGEEYQWLAFIHDCTGSSAGSINRFDPVNNPLDNLNQKYAICFDESLSRFGLKKADANQSDPNAEETFIVLRGSDNEPDPNAPLWFERTITFEPINATTSEGAGLQLLTTDEAGNIVLLKEPGAEPVQSVKVKAAVKWQDFDKSWSVEVSTILTNWRSQ